MIGRTHEKNELRRLLKHHRVVGIIGARQVGKTTLARDLVRGWRGPTHVFDLENPEDHARFADPMLALGKLKGLVVLDEVQRLPNLFPVIRVLADRTPSPVRFLILGSASPDLLQQSAETLAGRIIYHELQGFALDELGPESSSRLWLRGGLPRSYLARTNKESAEWRRAFIQTFLERDIPQLGITIKSTTLRRFWTMLAHYHGQVWNASEFARSFGIADTTVRRYLDLLTSALVVRQLLPWHENLKKRQVKSPKVYIADSGLLHGLLNLAHMDELESHPKVGASWEGFLINETVRRLGARSEECFFWSTFSGAEIDLFVTRGNRRLGFEIKRTSKPTVTPSMRSAVISLKLDRLYVIHAGSESFPLAEKINAVSATRLLKDVPPLR